MKTLSLWVRMHQFEKGDQSFITVCVCVPGGWCECNLDLHIQKAAPVSAAVGERYAHWWISRKMSKMADYMQRCDISGGNTGTPGLPSCTMSVWAPVVLGILLHLPAPLFIFSSGCPSPHQNLPSGADLLLVTSYFWGIYFLICFDWLFKIMK